jgi:hypothetical protein
MLATEADARELHQERLEEELAELSAHISAATARWLELVLAFDREGGAAIDGIERWLAYRCGLSGREAREYVRVAQALAELPAIRASFARGEVTFTKVRALTRVATPACEEDLLELAQVLTAAQLERALRAFRRLHTEQARGSQELENCDYYWGEDGSLYLPPAFRQRTARLSSKPWKQRASVFATIGATSFRRWKRKRRVQRTWRRSSTSRRRRSQRRASGRPAPSSSCTWTRPHCHTTQAVPISNTALSSLPRPRAAWAATRRR